MKYLLAILFLTFTFSEAQARPVSYPEGWTLMVMNNKDENSSHIHYSPTAKYSVGWKHEYLRDAGAHIDTVQINNLLKRWNKSAEQANLYLKSGIGIARDNGDYSPAAFTGLATDWETRRYFASYENKFFWTGKSEKFVKHSTRLGITPYIGDYGDLHTWLMLQADYDVGASDNFSVTPLVRFFKGNTLVEGGYNFDDGVQFNLIQRF